MSGHGKGKRAGARPRRRLRPGLVLLALGITLALIAWGYLVWAAIDFGADGRGGDTRGWWLLGLAGIGAVACLFVALMLLARLSRALGLVGSPDREAAEPPRPRGGKRAAR
ncbi:hypothetical protein [Nocardioides sp.]|uniref:hypothetical protein n=1 Tax=Nocardioides sp. TaxID=35761 RepID=UPI0039E22CE8